MISPSCVCNAHNYFQENIIENSNHGIFAFLNQMVFAAVTTCHETDTIMIDEVDSKLKAYMYVWI